MGNGDNQNRERNVRERILTFVQADEQARRTRLTEEEAQTLSAAAGRLDQLLKRVAEEEQARSKQLKDEDLQALRAAAGRLDRLLTRATEKEAVTELKQQPRRKKNTME